MLFEEGTANDTVTTDCEGANVTRIRPANQMDRVGTMIFIAPTNRADGAPLPIDEFPYTFPMYVGWVQEGQEHALLSSLQGGNPPTLAIYATARTTAGEVQRIKAVLEQDRICGEWFSVWRPLLGVVQILRDRAAEQCAAA